MKVDLTDLIRTTLEAKGSKYTYDKQANRFQIQINNGKGLLCENIYAFDENRVGIRVLYPFKADKSVYATMALYMADYNHNRSFGTLRINSDGMISMNYTYVILEPSDCNSTILNTHIDIFENEAVKIYDKLSRICSDPMGMPVQDRMYYRSLLRESLERLLGKTPEKENKSDTIVLPFADACT
ncbi:MAG: hypothetical protein K6E34_07100 [Lachnospiraceae bacterium]|nr:hypothetical protein [Lachnospiraceae bacterium]